jgi:hypothetical protein
MAVWRSGEAGPVTYLADGLVTVTVLVLPARLRPRRC